MGHRYHVRATGPPMRGPKESGALGEASNRSHLEKQRGESAGVGRRVRWRAGGRPSSQEGDSGCPARGYLWLQVREGQGLGSCDTVGREVSSSKGPTAPFTEDALPRSLLCLPGPRRRADSRQAWTDCGRWDPGGVRWGRQGPRHLSPGGWPPATPFPSTLLLTRVGKSSRTPFPFLSKSAPTPSSRLSFSEGAVSAQKLQGREA